MAILYSFVSCITIAFCVLWCSASFFTRFSAIRSSLRIRGFCSGFGYLGTFDRVCDDQRSGVADMSKSSRLAFFLRYSVQTFLTVNPAWTSTLRRYAKDLLKRSTAVVQLNSLESCSQLAEGGYPRSVFGGRGGFCFTFRSWGWEWRHCYRNPSN
jgi:hypothetical protein